MEHENNMTVMALLTEIKSIQRSFATLQRGCTFPLKEHGGWSTVSFYVHVLAEILKESALPNLV